jgi:hypothetical protein
LDLHQIHRKLRCHRINRGHTTTGSSRSPNLVCLSLVSHIVSPQITQRIRHDEERGDLSPPRLEVLFSRATASPPRRGHSPPRPPRRSSTNSAENGRTTRDAFRSPRDYYSSSSPSTSPRAIGWASALSALSSSNNASPYATRQTGSTAASPRHDGFHLEEDHAHPRGAGRAASPRRSTSPMNAHSTANGQRGAVTTAPASSPAPSTVAPTSFWAGAAEGMGNGHAGDEARAGGWGGGGTDWISEVDGKGGVNVSVLATRHSTTTNFTPHRVFNVVPPLTPQRVTPPDTPHRASTASPRTPQRVSAVATYPTVNGTPDRIEGIVEPSRSSRVVGEFGEVDAMGGVPMRGYNEDDAFNALGAVSPMARQRGVEAQVESRECLPSFMPPQFIHDVRFVF